MMFDYFCLYPINNTMAYSLPLISDYMMKEHQKYLRDLPINQREAIRQYINGSSYLNHLLREGFNATNEEHCKYYTSDMKQRVLNMDNALSRDDLRNFNREQDTFCVFRGINSDTLGQVIERNGYLHHPHFMSTSTLMSVAANSFGGFSCCVFQIVVDNNKSTTPDYLYISHDGSVESEVLFARNTYLNLLSKTEHPQTKQQMYIVEASTSPAKAANAGLSKNSNTQNASTQLAELLLSISLDEVEDEIAFLNDDDVATDESAIQAITESLKQTYKGVPFEDLKAVVDQKQ
jgi:ADP-ribosyltransferase exoenzyme